jgi:hypothetical protein
MMAKASKLEATEKSSKVKRSRKTTKVKGSGKTRKAKAQLIEKDIQRTNRSYRLKEKEVITIKTAKSEIRIFRKAKGEPFAGLLYVEVFIKEPNAVWGHNQRVLPEQGITIFVKEK